MFDQDVSAQQVELLNEYKDVLIDPNTNEVKSEFHYEDGQLSFILYTLASNENEQLKISELQSEVEHFATLTRITSGTDVIETEKEYWGSTLNWKTRYLVRFGYRICWEPIDLVTGVPNAAQTRKFYFDDEGIELLEASYHADTSLRQIIYKPFGDDNAGQDWEYYDQSTFTELELIFPESISYYLTASLDPQSV